MSDNKYHRQQRGKVENHGKWVPCQGVCAFGEHIDESQYRRELNKDLVKTAVENATTVEESLRQNELLDIMNREYIPVTSYGRPTLIADLEAQSARLSDLAYGGTRDECEAYLQERINNPDFIDALAKREETQQVIKGLMDDREVLKKEFAVNPQFSYEDVRAKEFALLDANEELKILRSQINEYKDVTAELANHIAEYDIAEAQANGTWKEFDAETLNNMTKTAYFPSGSREWLEQRQNGIGGSDIGSIIGAKTAFSSRAEIMDTKLNPITDEEVASQELDQMSFKGPLARGNAWEKRIFLDLQERLPDRNVTFCKTSWANNTHGFQFANFDGLETDADGTPIGIIEIKTASNPDKWGPESAGLDGVPDAYRAQTLWYAHAAGFKQGTVAVVIDDRETRIYHFEVTPEIEAEQERNLAAAQTFVTELAARKAGAPAVKRAFSRGFSKTVVDGSVSSEAKQRLFSEVAALRGMNTAQVQSEFMTNIKAEELSDPAQVETHLRKLYTDTAKQTPFSYVGLDIETAGSQPYSGRIIELGATVRQYNKATGKIEEAGSVSSLYGLKKKSLMAHGTGQEEVHGITASQISKKRNFNNPEVAGDILKTLKDNRFLLAHNASFERRWLNTHIPGFADAVKRGDIVILDSMHYNRRFFAQSTPNDTLESYTGRFGIQYVNAHRAYSDAKMMSDAWDLMWDSWRQGM